MKFVVALRKDSKDSLIEQGMRQLLEQGTQQTAD